MSFGHISRILFLKLSFDMLSFRHIWWLLFPNSSFQSFCSLAFLTTWYEIKHFLTLSQRFLQMWPLYNTRDISLYALFIVMRVIRAYHKVQGTCSCNVCKWSAYHFNQTKLMHKGKNKENIKQFSFQLKKISVTYLAWKLETEVTWIL